MAKLQLRPFTSGVGKISTANEELINVPVNGNVRKYTIIEFYANADCTLIWNNELELEIKAGAGLYLDERFKMTESLIIKESGIEYFFACGF